MGAESAWQRRPPVPAGTRAGDYQTADTLASLSMGLGSLVAPYAAKKLLDPVTPGLGRYAKVLVGVGAAAGLATTVADVLARRARHGGLPQAGTVPEHVREVQDELAELRFAARADGPGRAGPRQDRRGARTSWTGAKVRGALAVSAVTSTALTVATTWAAQTSGKRMFARSRADLGTGKAAVAVAVLGWDFLYYWNHRLSHESRWLWAVHVAHHSSERYNLSTALRQPVAEGVTLTVPFGVLGLLGVRPALIEHARGINLIYQFWIHTETIRRLGRLEKVLNTPSHHRVHHGANRQYLDKNYGGVLIVWDRLFGTFEPEVRRLKYGPTKNITTYNPLCIAYHEFAAIGRDVRRATGVRAKLGHVFGRPGWAPPR